MSEQINCPYEDVVIRCPRLGGNVTFSFCEYENVDLPCNKSLECWSYLFKVEEFFRNKLSDEEFNHCFRATPKPKLATLIELIEKAQQTLDK